MATLTKSIGTVTLAGAAEKVTLPAFYGWVWVKNMSDSDIFAGLSEDISEGADGVLTIPSGECGRVQMDGSREFYLLGTGNALVVAQNYAECPFKAGVKGGEIPDLTLYAKKTDIPTELPANGGNADTVGGFDAYHMGTTTYAGAHYPPEQFPIYCKYNAYDDGRFAFLIDSSHQPERSYEIRCDYAANAGNANTFGEKSISDFIYAHGYYTGNVDDIKYPFSGIVINATGVPPQTSVWGTMLCYAGGTGSYAQIWVSSDNNNTTMFVRHSDGNRWTEWAEIYASGNKPYITGSATVAAGDNTCITNHGFTPSAVLWWENSGGREIRSASSFDTTSFNPSVIDTSERVLNYIIFK